MKDVELATAPPPPGVPAASAAWRLLPRRLLLRSAAVCLDGLVTTLVPSECVACGSPLARFASIPICGDCVAALVPQHFADGQSQCSRCGAAAGFESARVETSMGVRECSTCRLTPPAFARAVAYGLYAGELRELLHLLKYNGMTALARTLLADRLASVALSLRPELTAAGDVCVIAVPLFAARRRRRGFNQAELLADGMIEVLASRPSRWKLRAAHNALVRSRDTSEQFSMNPRQRRHNLRGAFAVADPAAVRGRDVLLVDDIMTTGATARECARVLVRAGASRVFVATLARAQQEVQVATWDAPVAPTTFT